VIRLPPALLSVITGAAEAAYPEECCGLLVGSSASDGWLEVTRVVESPNRAGAFDGKTDVEADVGGGEIPVNIRRRRFEIDPLIRLSLMRETENTDQTIIGFYHSHPDHPAQPSAQDIASIWEPDLVWLIVSVDAGKVVETAAFQPSIEGGNREFMPLELVTSLPSA